MAARQERCVLDQLKDPEQCVLECDSIYLRQMCQMLASQHEDTQAMGANKFQQLVKEDITAALGANVLQYLVLMAKAEGRSTRAAAAAALAVLATSPSGRDAARVSGALPLLVLMLDEGPHSLAAEQAAKALMNAAVSDVSKDTIRKSGGILSLLQLVKQGSEASLHQRHSSPLTDDPPLPPCPAAVHAVGAISNMLQAECKRISRTMQQADGLSTLQTVAQKHSGNVLGARAQLAATMLTHQLAASSPQKDWADAALAPAGINLEAAGAGVEALTSPAIKLPAISGTTSSPMRSACCSSGQPVTAGPAAAADASITPRSRRTTAEELTQQLSALSKPKACPKTKQTSSNKQALVKEPIAGLADALGSLGTAPGVDPVHGVGAATKPAGLTGSVSLNSLAVMASTRGTSSAAGKLASKRESTAEAAKSIKGGAEELKDGASKWMV